VAVLIFLFPRSQVLTTAKQLESGESGVLGSVILVGYQHCVVGCPRSGWYFSV